ncbi:MAG: polyphosphate glucokinase [Chloroflexota bacterium]|jgi:polyphosphate glucokinase|nr:polyphosphate glucokinase [Chloroflexota bacterium]
MNAWRSTSEDEYPSVPSPAARLTGRALGIDIGGTGIKAAVVDLASGELVTDRIREPTPRPATREAVLDVVVDVVRQLEATGKLTAGMRGGAGFPSVIRAGHAMTATHGDPSWIGAPVQQMLEERLRRQIVVLNDADAAAVAEIAYGAGKAQHGVVLLLDLGTGIGSSLFINGQLVPNMQLGHIEFRGEDAEIRLSPVARLRRKIGWSTWGPEFNELLARYETYIWPDLIILGGGTAKEFPKYRQFLKTTAPLVVAAIGTTAGIVGAARVGGSAIRA